MCECRNSDDIMVVIGDDKNCDVNNIFDDDAFNRAKYFKCEDYDNAVDYALKYLKVLFEKNFKQQIHIKYDVYRNIDDIRRIQIDADGLDYEDYYELASLYNEDEQYSCDLVISKGKMGYNYNKCIDGHIEKLTFMECNPNLENEITLMVDMKENLNKFIYNELSYDLEFNNKGISI